MSNTPDTTMSKTKALICPYCARMQRETDRCSGCGGFLDHLSRQATQNAMGPWYLYGAGRAFHPGCSYETIVKLVERGEIAKHTIMRGPTTRQFWTIAKRVPCVAHLLGYCHECDADVDAADVSCSQCSAAFGAYLDRNHLGVSEINPLPWETDVDEPEGAGVIGPRVRMEDDPPPPPNGNGGRISSFATNEQLGGGDSGSHVLQPAAVAVAAEGIVHERGDGGVSVETQAPEIESSTTAAPANPGVVTAESGDAQAVSAESAVADPMATGIATRSLQRRLAQNGRLIRRLMMLIAVSVAANLVLAVMVINNGLQGDDGATGTPAGQTDDDATGDDRAGQDRTDADRSGRTAASDSTDRSSSSAAQQSDDAASVIVVTDKTADTTSTETVRGNGGDQAADAASQQLEQIRAEVAAHFEQARDAERDMDARIASYEQVISLLKPVIEAMEMNIDRRELSDELADAESEVERLRLRKFFG